MARDRGRNVARHEENKPVVRVHDVQAWALHEKIERPGGLWVVVLSKTRYSLFFRLPVY